MDLDNRSTLLNAVIGAAVTLLTSFIGVSALLGGGVAGYLEEGDLRDGAMVGTISGLMVSVLMVPFFFLFVMFFGFVDLNVAVFGGIMFLFMFVFVVLYNVALSAIGGVVGAYIYQEMGSTPRGQSPPSQNEWQG